jgi:hypothetical protein
MTRLLWNQKIHYRANKSSPRGLRQHFVRLWPLAMRNCHISAQPLKLEDHPLSAISGCLFNIFACTLHTWRTVPPSANLGRDMPLWHGTHWNGRGVLIQILGNINCRDILIEWSDRGGWDGQGMGEKCIQNLVGEHELNKRLGRSMRRWEDSISMDLTEVGWEDVDCIHLTQNTNQWLAVVNTVISL